MEGHHDQNSYPELLLQRHVAGPSRQRSVGEIVEVQGGHIMRSSGRKDRHSKVCTAKGPRDRRVRLSAHTAIQFYDVQDRLGYDRPSKAVDWLIKNAKAAIDELAELPPWRPTAATAAATDASLPNCELHGTSSVLGPSLDSVVIADTVKSSFAVATTRSQGAADHTHAEDLRLSLQSFHNHAIPLHHRRSEHVGSTAEQTLFSGSSAPLVFEQNPGMVPCVAAMGGDNNGGTGGYAFNVPPPAPSQPPSQAGAIPMHHVLGQSFFLAQRGPLQSSNSPLTREWIGHPPQTLPTGRSVDWSFASFASFQIPARIGGEEEHDGISGLQLRGDRSNPVAKVALLYRHYGGTLCA